ncbi:MAG: PA0069 family radical SAM protein [Pseudomonadota bacterium]
MSAQHSKTPPKGRGALSNADGRYERVTHEAFDDGWTSADEQAPSIKTTVAVDARRSVINSNVSPDVGFDRSINPYRGCEHGCIYCFARPTHAYLGLSPGLDFETRLIAKPDAALLLRQELRRRGYHCQPIALGTNTDPYQPVERRWRIMRQILEVLAECAHPVSIVTKSALVERDIDLLAPMAAKGLAQVYISLPTLDRTLARRLEPRAAAPERRVQTLRALHAAGIPVGVLVAPIIPVLTDGELETILETAHAAGARGAGYVLLRLPLEVKDLFSEWLATHAPGKREHVLSLLRQAHGGKEYDARPGARMSGSGAYADMLAQRWAAACKRLGFNEQHTELDVTQFRPPADHQQLMLF